MDGTGVARTADKKARHDGICKTGVGVCGRGRRSVSIARRVRAMVSTRVDEDEGKPLRCDAGVKAAGSGVRLLRSTAKRDSRGRDSATAAPSRALGPIDPMPELEAGIELGWSPWEVESAFIIVARAVLTPLETSKVNL
jgi:hypothetical protein